MKTSAHDSSIRVRLYVAGDAPSSRRAQRRLRAVLAEVGRDDLDYEIIDVLREPDRALASNLLATPTLIVEQGRDATRYVGDRYEHADLVAWLTPAPATDPAD